MNERRNPDVNDQLRNALGRAAGGDPHVDLTDTVWAQGRVVRRRRQVAQTVGALAAVGVIAGAFALGGGLLEPQADVGPAVPTVQDTATATWSTPVVQAGPTRPAAEDTQEETAAPVTGTGESAAAPTGTGEADPTGPESEPPASEPPTTDPPSSEPPTDPPTVIDPCTTAYPDPVLVVGDTPESTRTKAAGVLGQAADCNLAGLIELARQDQTFLSFGALTPEVAFSGEEGARRARAITILLTEFAPAVEGADAPYRWPGAVVTDEDWQRVVDTGLYSQEEADLMRSSGMGYTGWRVGVTADGTWAYLVAGD